MGKAKRKQVDVEAAQPTPERRKHAGPFFYQANRHALAFHDDALGRAEHRGVIDEPQAAALRLYARHWYVAGQYGHLGSPALERVSCGSAGDPDSERTLDALRIWRVASSVLSDLERRAADEIACRGYSLAEFGASLGYASPYRARSKAGELLASAGQALVRFWSRRH